MIAVKNLTKTFGRTLAVDDISFEVSKGEVVGFLGPNAAGKTTTMRMLTCYIAPDSGTATVAGYDVSEASLEVRKRVGYLPESAPLYLDMDVIAYLEFVADVRGIPPGERSRRVRRMVEVCGLETMLGRTVGTLSKGYRQRVGLAQTLIHDPEILILDEPTTGLDPIGTRQIKDLILRLAERGKTVLLCSHLLGDVEDVCHRIAILYGGKVQAQGRVRDLLQQTNKRQIITDAVSDATVNRIRRILSDEHAECEVTAPMEKLETFFIKTVVEAQQQARPTSGAVSTTQIGDFLTAGGRKENILDKLVSTSVAEPVKTEAVQPRETTTAEPNKALLSKLTQTSASPQTEHVSPEEGAKTQPVETPTETQREEVKKSVLDKLTKNGETGHA